MSNRSQVYKYVAMDVENGSMQRGELSAINERNASAQVEQMGFEVLSLKAAPKSILQADISLFEKITPTQIYNFTRQLSVMLKAGVPLVDALDSLHSESAGPLVN